MQKTKSIALILGVLTMSFLVGYLAFAWTGPTASPPGDNVPAPLNVDSVDQIKSGGLSVGAFISRFGTILARDSGNVGIGTPAPGQRLTVAGNVWIQGSHLIIDRPDTTGGWARGIMYYPTGSSSGTELAGIGLLGSGTSVTRIYLAHGGSPWASTAGIHILTNGYVGIGTTSPGAKLEVVGQIKITGGSPGLGKALISDAAGLASWQTITGTLPSGTSGQTLRHDGTNWVANSVIYNNGTNIGIGTTSPGYKLEVIGTGRVSGALTLGTQASATDHAVRADRTISAGTGLTGGGNLTADRTISVDTTYLQRRVTGTCASNQAIRVINVDGTVSCVTVGTGTITGVTAGSGLTGGGTSGNVTLNVGAGTGISVGATTVGLAYPTKSCGAGQAIQSFDLGSSAAPTCVAAGGTTGCSNVFYRVYGNSGSITASGCSSPLYILGEGGITTRTSGNYLYISGGLSCTTASKKCSSSVTCLANCPSGYAMTGGGFYLPVTSELFYDMPYGNGWYINTKYTRDITAYVRCCR